MSLIESVYEIGDWIVHAHYGVGQVMEEDEKSLGGETQMYLKVLTFEGEYWLSVENFDVDHIRPLASQSQFRRAVMLMGEAPNALPKDYKLRGKVVGEAMRDVSLYTKARMIRDLNGKRYGKNLNFSEENALEHLKKCLINEWGVLRGKEKIEILERKMEEALAKSLDKSDIGSD